MPSLTQEIGETKKQQLDYHSPESTLNQGDSDWESTSVSSSMQGSISSVDQESNNVKGGTEPKKALKKSNSKKLSTFGSFMSSRRRAQSRLSQSSVKSSDDSSTTPPHPSSSIEVSDESSNYVQKPMPKFTRAGSLRSVKILRSKSKNKKKSSFQSKKSLIDKTSEVSESSHLEKGTFSSILKDSKFPEHLKHQTGPLESEEVLPEAKICPYQHCSLHGHHHHHEPPKKRFPFLKGRTTKDQKSVNLKPNSEDKSFGKKREAKVPKNVSNGQSGDVDFSIEFYLKTRSEPMVRHGRDDAEFADILFDVNGFHEKKNETPISDLRDCTDLNNKKDENSDGSKSVLKKKPALKKTNDISMWHTIHRHIVFGLASESGEMILPEEEENEKKPQTKDDDASSQDQDQETEIRKMFAIKLVREAIEKILLPEVQDDQSTTSEVILEQDLSEKNPNDRIEEPQETGKNEPIETKTKKRTPKSWSYLKKVILLRKFVKELEKVKKFNPKKPQHLPLPPGSEAETVSLRHQTTGGKKNSNEWMLDYALQKVVSELAPTQKRKVAMLVKAFETVAPAPDIPQETESTGRHLDRVSSEPKVKFQETSESVSLDSNTKSEINTPSNPISGSFSRDLDKSKHIKMWHMIYQHVVTDIATKIGSDLLLDGEESTNSEEKNMEEVEGQSQTEQNYRLQFTQSDAVNLIRESVDEILLPEVSEDIELKQLEKDSEPTIEGSKPTITSRLQLQKSENWSKLKKLIVLKRSIKALEGFRKIRTQIPQEKQISISDRESERVKLRNRMMDERKKAEQWMLDYAVQHIVTKLTPARKKRVSMLVEAFEAVVPLPEI